MAECVDLTCCRPMLLLTSGLDAIPRRPSAGLARRACAVWSIHLTSLLYVLLPWNWKTESEDSQHLRRLPRSADILRLEQVRGNCRQNRVRTRLFAGGRWIRTIGPWRHAVGSVMEIVDNLAEPAGRAIPEYDAAGMLCSGSRKREHGLAPLSPCGPSPTLGVADSQLEGNGFEPLVPRRKKKSVEAGHPASGKNSRIFASNSRGLKGFAT